jgi:hypothetical protein
MGKRGNGEGSISRRKDGLYMARYWVETPAGKKRRTLPTGSRRRSGTAAKGSSSRGMTGRSLLSWTAGSQVLSRAP